MKIIRNARLWERNGDIVRIEQVGDTVKAVMVSPSAEASRRGRSVGDIAFEGHIDGRSFGGTAYLLFSPEDTSACPTVSGERESKLELILSEDGNRLDGRRGDFHVASDCQIIDDGFIDVTYVRAGS